MYFWLETGMEINLNIETFNLGDISKNYPVNMIYQIIQPHKWLHSCRAQTPQSMYFGVTDNYDNQYCIIYSIFKHYPVYPVLSGIILHFSTPLLGHFLIPSSDFYTTWLGTLKLVVLILVLQCPLLYQGFCRNSQVDSWDPN